MAWHCRKLSLVLRQSYRPRVLIVALGLILVFGGLKNVHYVKYKNQYVPEDSAGGSLRGGGSSRGAERGGPLSSRSR